MAKGFGKFGGSSGGGGGGQNAMLRQLQKLQEQMEVAQAALAEETVTASVGGGAVKSDHDWRPALSGSYH